MEEDGPLFDNERANGTTYYYHPAKAKSKYCNVRSKHACTTVGDLESDKTECHTVSWLDVMPPTASISDLTSACMARRLLEEPCEQTRDATTNQTLYDGLRVSCLKATLTASA